jgi:uncharacterized cupin superfamily protein
VTLVHWDDVEGFDVPAGVQPLGGRWQRLADAAGSVRVGLQRVVLAPGQMITPPHVHSAEEEIFHVLRGSATLWQDGLTCTVAAGDTIVHPARGEPHTLIGGDDGVDVLIFGTRVVAEHGVLPRTSVAWIGDRGVTLNADHPWQAESALGLPDGTAGKRPANVVALGDVEGDYGGMSKRLGAAGGAKVSGLNKLALPSNEEGAPPHCHSSEEEVFAVLEGAGVLELWGAPTAGEPPRTEPDETLQLRPGHIVSRPAGTRISHCFRAGTDGLTYLAYGTRDANDVAYYPRSNKIFFRGLGVIARLEQLDYFDGEPG